MPVFIQEQSVSLNREIYDVVELLYDVKFPPISKFDEFSIYIEFTVLLNPLING